MINANYVANALAAYKAPEAVKNHQVSPKCDVYCLGIIILEVLTGKYPSQYVNKGQGGTDLVQWVKSAMQEQREVELLDPAITGSSKYIGEMKKLLHIGSHCTESDPESRLDIREVIRSLDNIQVGDENMISSFDNGYDDAVSTVTGVTDSSYISMVPESRTNNNESVERDNR